jgi:serine O-acetyltransferase
MNRVIFSVDINMKSDLAGGLRFIHGIGIVIGNKVRTEGAVKIYQGVTLGGNHGKSKSYNGKKISMPVIKQNVSIYSGAKILGPVVIGENSSVGVNAVITRDIPENTIAYGVNQIKAKEDD